jgi:hypothetical protein
MEMMDCPHCGERNSTKRDYCYQCDGDLRGAPSGTADLDYMPTCANCAQASMAPPPGEQLGPDQVWCSDREGVVPSFQMAGDCFTEAFGWKREDILD